MRGDPAEVKRKHMRESGANLIFILGIMQRSGTNYLNNLLLMHPDSDYPGFVWEDYLIAHAEHLNKYTNSVYQSWSPSWKNKVEEVMGHDPIMSCIGEGLSLFIRRQYESSSQTRGRSSNKEGEGQEEFPKLVTATPNVNNLRHFFQLLPHAHLLIIIRDGRSIVESGIKSFDWDFEHAVRRWMNAAERIFEFDGSGQEGRYLIVRYEDLYANAKDEMIKILSFLGLDTERYDFKTAANLTVMGSSDLRSSEGRIHWKARERNSDFNPIGRWRHWKRPQHERFNWLAGAGLERFGYAQQQYNSRNELWKLWNIVLDKLYGIEIWLQPRMHIFCKSVRRLRMTLYSLPGKFYSGASENISIQRET
jgi:hypothetical protein